MDNILFYSNKCNHCKKIISLINEIDNIDSYKLICIDNNNNQNFKFIQRVPTLLTTEKKPLVGINAFKWINAKNQFNNNTNNINNNPNKNLSRDLNPLLFKNDNEFNNNNNYSYVDDKLDKISESITNNLQSKDKIYTLPEGDRINNKMQKKKLVKLMNLRTRQDSTLFNDVDTSMSSNNSNLKNNKVTTSNFDNINNKINKINFSVPPRISQTTPNINSLGEKTNYNIIKKQFKD